MPVHRAAGADDGVAGAGQQRGSASIGRAPGFSSRVKQSCRLSKRLLPGVAEVEIGEQAPDRDRRARHQRVADLAEPAHEARRAAAAGCGWSAGSSGLPAGASVADTLMASPDRRGTGDGRMFEIERTSPRWTPGARGAAASGRLSARLALSRAKHPSLAGHARMARGWRAAAGLRYDDARFLARRRRAGRDRRAAPGRLERLGALARDAQRRSRAPPRPRAHLSDLQFTAAYRVPFQFSPCVSASTARGRLSRASEACTVPISTATPATTWPAPTASTCSATTSTRAASSAARSGCRAGRRARQLPPGWCRQRARLARISGMDEVSFHMSGTEAVMQAVRLARYHTAELARALLRRLSRLVGRRAAGLGNPVPPHETYTLAEMSERTLDVLRSAARHRLRAGQPVAGAAPERRRAGRFDPRRQPARRARRSCHLCGVAEGAAHGLHRARHRADLRRSLRRLPPGAWAAPRNISAWRPTS